MTNCEQYSKGKIKTHKYINKQNHSSTNHCFFFDFSSLFLFCFVVFWFVLICFVLFLFFDFLFVCFLLFVFVFVFVFFFCGGGIWNSGDLLREVQFIWYFLWQDKIDVTTWVVLTIYKNNNHKMYNFRIKVGNSQMV